MRSNSANCCNNKFNNVINNCKDARTGNTFLHIYNVNLKSGCPSGQLHPNISLSYFVTISVLIEFKYFF